MHKIIYLPALTVVLGLSFLQMSSALLQTIVFCGFFGNILQKQVSNFLRNLCRFTGLHSALSLPVLQILTTPESA